MKVKYRLKKDLPTLKAGTLFTSEMYNRDGGEDADVEVLEFGDYEFRRDSIDNFDEWFEEVKRSSWEMPTRGDNYYFINDSGVIVYTIWMENSQDRVRYLMDNCFRTTEAAERYGGYLKAVTTVRQDEGVIDLQGIREEYEATPDNKYDEFCVYTVAFNLYLRKLVVTDADEYISANAIWFDTMEHAQASLDKHLDEWRIIANYDWSRE